MVPSNRVDVHGPPPYSCHRRGNIQSPVFRGMYLSEKDNLCFLRQIDQYLFASIYSTSAPKKTSAEVAEGLQLVKLLRAWKAQTGLGYQRCQSDCRLVQRGDPQYPKVGVYIEAYLFFFF
jgi:hypothetical protein